MIEKRSLSVLCLILAFSLVASVAGARMSPRQIYKSKASGVVLIVAAPKGASSASAGTGSIIRDDGTIVTNCHVILNPDTHKPYAAIHVFLKPARVTGDMNKDLSRHFEAGVVAYDENLDLALLRMKKAPARLTVLTLGNPDDLGPGDETVAIGHPEQGGLWTITTGVIGTEFENFKGVPGKHVFQMETSLNRGNSGGPLFDVRGYQVGVNTAIARKGQGGVAITGVNFALKASVVKDFAARQGIRLAYGPERLGEQEQVRVASAATSEQPPAARQPANPGTTADSGTPATAAATTREATGSGSASGGKRVYGSRETTGGTITVEDDGEGGQVVLPRPRQPRVTQSARHPTRRPVRFRSHYRLRPRPYSFRRLFTAVDRVRARAQEAFDDLDREVERWKRRH
ncbi:MAG: hypothetical protein DRI34_02855 [Deltaproteobacteria bacterium]|nr:MAG: hypothetical protein DRI34_02855 [Deltaproteobacteria bacterium]